jgi:hypothetical protein
MKTGLNKKVFPNKCPYSLQQLLDNDWFPDTINLESD